MKTALKTGLCLLIAACVLQFAGCKKKEEPAKQSAPAAAVKTEAAKTAAEQPKPAVAPAPAPAPVPAEAPKAAETAAATALDTVPIADVQAQAGKMTVDQLKAKAMEYKNLIMSKKSALEQATAKLKAIPLTEQMGTEAKGLQTDIAALNKTISALTERFQVYYNKIKEMGGDVSGLGLT